MFCTKCGSQIPEGANFCARCGAPAIQPQSNRGQARQPWGDENDRQHAYDRQDRNQAPGTKKTKAPLVIAIVAVVAVIAAVLFLVLGRGGDTTSGSVAEPRGGIEEDRGSAQESTGSAEDDRGSVEDLVNGFIQTVLEPDLTKALTMIHPAEHGDANLSEENLSEINTFLGTQLTLAKMVNGTVSAEMEGSRPITGSELDQLADTYQTRYGLRVTDAEAVDVAVLVDMFGKRDEQNLQLICVKIDGVWYVSGSSLDGLV